MALLVSNRDALTHFVQFVVVDIGVDNCLVVFRFSQHFGPRIDHNAVSIRMICGRLVASGRNHRYIQLIVNSTRSRKQLPMQWTCGCIERTLCLFVCRRQFRARTKYIVNKTKNAIGKNKKRERNTQELVQDTLKIERLAVPLCDQETQIGHRSKCQCRIDRMRCQRLQHRRRHLEFSILGT